MGTKRAVIVGGGNIGTMHALEACRRGWDAVHLEADAGPRRASVRSFGLVWVSGRAAGPELDLALRVRQRWQEIARDSPGVGFRPDGSLTGATDAAELALMDEAASRTDASSRSFELLDAAGVRSINPAVRVETVGGSPHTRWSMSSPALAAVAARASSIISVAAIRARWCSCASAIGCRDLGAASERPWRRRHCGAVASR
jgi:glycine/D-amino acid oxidase-like deaminating enzyme